jgi:predicted transcriptional regulator
VSSETHALTVRLEPDLADRLALARAATRTPSADIIRGALRAYLLALESGDAYQERYAELRRQATP